MKTSPDRRRAIVSDLYKLHCEGLTFHWVIFFNSLLTVMNAEVVLNQNEELFHTMIECSILENLVDIICSGDCDSETLVC